MTKENKASNLEDRLKAKIRNSSLDCSIFD